MLRPSLFTQAASPLTITLTTETLHVQLNAVNDNSRNAIIAFNDAFDKCAEICKQHGNGLVKIEKIFPTFTIRDTRWRVNDPELLKSYSNFASDLFSKNHISETNFNDIGRFITQSTQPEKLQSCRIL